MCDKSTGILVLRSRLHKKQTIKVKRPVHDKDNNYNTINKQVAVHTTAIMITAQRNNIV